MQLILGSLNASHLYVNPSGEYIYNCLIVFIGGNAINQVNALSYWVKPVIVTPLIELGNELVTLTDTFACKYQRTLISLPVETRGINIFIPSGNTINVYIN